MRRRGLVTMQGFRVPGDACSVLTAKTMYERSTLDVAAAADAQPSLASTDATACCGCSHLSNCVRSARASPPTQKSRIAWPKEPLRPLRASTHATNPALLLP